MKQVGLRKIRLLLLLLAGAGVAWAAILRIGVLHEQAGEGEGLMPAPVEVAAIDRGPIELRRTYSGELEAQAQFIVAPKISGRIHQLDVDAGDVVTRGQTVAILDSDEYIQAVAQAEADLAVARANLAEAESALEIANRELRRVETLRKRGVASDSELDTAKAGQLAKRAALEVAMAQVTKALAVLESSRIRLSYTQVKAQWPGGDPERIVAERFVDEGETVSANASLVSVVEIDPIIGVIFVTEKEYTRLRPGQSVFLTTDAYPGERVTGEIHRIHPVFQKATRQAKVEIRIDNPRHRLKPGMFIRATVVLDRVEEATIVPEPAITRRNDRTGVFVLSDDGRSVVWREVTIGIREAGRVQVEGDGLSGRVVVLGQQLLEDGSAITIPEQEERAGVGGVEAG
ncbi:MAG: efflux RND transporter periplasmic adaptor subunit [Desulfobacterales bacterium]